METTTSPNWDYCFEEKGGRKKKEYKKERELSQHSIFEYVFGWTGVLLWYVGKTCIEKNLNLVRGVSNGQVRQ